MEWTSQRLGLALRRQVRSLAFAGMLVGAAAAGTPVPADSERPSPSAAPAAEAVLERLQKWLDETVDLHGQFQQAVVSGALQVGLDERGLLYVQRPGRMRWDYIDPEHKIAILNGERTWLYIEEDRELMLGRLDEAGRLLPALWAGEERLSDSFARPELLATPQDGGTGAYLVRLRPLPGSGGEAFEEAVLRIRPPEYAIEAAEVVDPTGNRVRYSFVILQRNRGVDSGLFEFEPPEGTYVSGRH